MDPCADPITSRILKLHQKLLNNIFYWNPEVFFEKNESEFNLGNRVMLSTECQNTK